MEKPKIANMGILITLDEYNKCGQVQNYGWQVCSYKIKWNREYKSQCMKMTISLHIHKYLGILK